MYKNTKIYKARQKSIRLFLLLFAFSLFSVTAFAASTGDDSSYTLIDKIVNTFSNGRYRMITDGLLITLEITAVALVIGLVLGFLVAIIRSTYEKNHKLKIANFICQIYLTVFRGTPVVVQLMIIYFLWLSKYGIHENIVAMISFGLNSGAYVAEIVRSGIMSIDNGQFEASRSLGFNYTKTMIYVIMPQAIKNVLPAIANEFIVLLKETSVASFIAVKDMMKGAKSLAGVTYDMYVPYITVALIYLVMVVILQQLVKLLERRLRKNER